MTFPAAPVSDRPHDQPDAPRRVSAASRRFVLWFFVVLTVITTAALAPLWLSGADADAFNAVVPALSWAPTVAVIVAYVLSGRPAPFLRWTALRPAISWRIAGIAALMLAIFAAIPVATTAIGVWLGLVAWEPAPDAAALVPFIVPLALLGMLMTLGEEIGWRGGLQTALTPLGPWRGSVIIGVAWSLWHLPLTLGYAASGDMALREVVATTINLILISGILSAARLLSSSVWPAVWSHALMNTTLVFVASNLITPTRDLADGPFWAFNAISWGVLAIGSCACLAVADRRARAASPTPVR